MAHDTTFDSDGGSDSSGTINRRRFIQATGAGAAATVIAGCGDGGDSGDDGSGDGTDGTQPGTTTSSTPEPVSEPVSIGVLVPENNILGRGAREAARMRVEQLNEAEGIADQDVEVHIGNTETLPTAAQSAASELINQEGVDVLVGTFNSEVSQTVLPVATDNDVPFIVAGSAAPSTITDFIGENYEEYKNVFRSGPINSDFQAEAMSQYATHLSDLHGWTDYEFLAEEASWTQPYNNNLPGLLRDQDLTVTGQTRIPTDTTEFESVMENTRDNDADALLRFFAVANGGPMAGQWHQAAPRYQFGIEGIHVTSMAPAYFEGTSGAATFETTSQSGAGGVAPITERTSTFVEDYQAYVEDADEAPSLPMYMAFSVTDGIGAYKAAVEEGGTKNFAEYADTFVDAMLGVDHTGVAGRVRFYGADTDYPHDVMETRNQSDEITNFPVTQWRPDGNFECIYPEVHATADHLQPTWMTQS